MEKKRNFYGNIRYLQIAHSYRFLKKNLRISTKKIYLDNPERWKEFVNNFYFHATSRIVSEILPTEINKSYVARSKIYVSYLDQTLIAMQNQCKTNFRDRIISWQTYWYVLYMSNVLCLNSNLPSLIPRSLPNQFWAYDSIWDSKLTGFTLLGVPWVDFAARSPYLKSRSRLRQLEIHSK